MPNHSITAPRGFRAAAVACGIKANGKPDLALLVSDTPATAAAVFTTNKVVGAPVIVGRAHLRAGKLRACIANSGCANVCTGDRGINDARQMCLDTATQIVHEGESLPLSSILPNSTGVIGRYLPMDKIQAGIPRVAAALSDSEAGGNAFARGIMTTDLVPKTACTTLRLHGKTITIAGCCKGSGMIAPNMATMLAYIATDAAIALPALRRAIRSVTDRTFNCVTVDQHTSTSDTFTVLANGHARNRSIASAADTAKFTAALYHVADSLARQIARDGEGATKLVTIHVAGARNEHDAKRAAETIANSPLVKTAIHGGDPNWGRFISAAGYSGAAMNVAKSLCKVGALTVFKNGRPTDADLKAVRHTMKQSDVDITINLGTGGKATHRVYTCDLSREYIAINADYTT